MKITVERSLEVNNLVSKSGRYKTAEFQKEILDMVKIYGDYTEGGCVITTTKSLEELNGEQIIDVEILMPVRYRIPVEEAYVFKTNLKIINSLYMKVVDVTKLQDAFSMLNQYVLDHKLQPITSVYLVQTKVENLSLIELYMGLNPNIL